MDKKGQIDKAFEALPVFFAVTVIIILFSLLSAGIFGFQKFSDRDAAISSTHIPVLFSKITLDSGENAQEMSVLEGFRKYKLSLEMKEALEEIAPENGCLYIGYNDVQDIYGDGLEIILYQDRVERKSDWIDDLTGKSLLLYVKKLESSSYTFSFLDDPAEKYTLETYVGRCLDEK